MFEKLQTGEKIHDAPRQPNVIQRVQNGWVMKQLQCLLIVGTKLNLPCFYRC